MENIEKNMEGIREIADDELDAVVGGYAVGDEVTVINDKIEYCPRCATLLCRYTAKLTGVRGVLDGHTVYWIERNCCGYKTSEIETAFV